MTDNIVLATQLLAVGVNKAELPDCYEALTVRRSHEDAQLVILFISAGVASGDLKTCMEFLKLSGGSAEDQKLIFLLLKAGVKSENLRRCFDAL
jgi:hypothetical protein